MTEEIERVGDDWRDSDGVVILLAERLYLFGTHLEDCPARDEEGDCVCQWPAVAAEWEAWKRANPAIWNVSR